MRGGFTFLEVLFAVIILGIGTIMVAGFLTVGATQVSLARSDFIGSTSSASGGAMLKSLWTLDPSAFPPTMVGTEPRWFHPRIAAREFGPNFRRHAFSQCLGSTFDASTSTAWIPFYYRPRSEAAVAGTCQVIVVSVDVIGRDGQNVESVGSFWNLTGLGVPFVSDNLLPVRLQISKVHELESSLRYGISFESPDEAVVEGAVVIFERDAQGRIFRLGAKENGIWELTPDSDLPVLNPVGAAPDAAKPLDQSLNNQFVYVIGRRLSDNSVPPSPSNPYVGASIVKHVTRFVMKG